MFDIASSPAPAAGVLAGEHFRDAAAAVAFDRIVGDCLDREWVIVPKPQPNKARHGNRNAALERRPIEDLTHE
ncbi:hypothetical protein [Burkholderia gladioli]|uniref:hypothetical protein n=1 Tax=Burkholderia gladioli TaxID=28095 RepID=UPI0016403927|nr:hypothetical protein [Burkholderia gladioli]